MPAVAIRWFGPLHGHCGCFVPPGGHHVYYYLIVFTFLGLKTRLCGFLGKIYFRAGVLFFFGRNFNLIIVSCCQEPKEQK